MCCKPLSNLHDDRTLAAHAEIFTHDSLVSILPIPQAIYTPTLYRLHNSSNENEATLKDINK